MIDKRLTYNINNPVLENIILTIPTRDLDKLMQNEELINTLIQSVIDNKSFEEIEKVIKYFGIKESDGFILLGMLSAQVIVEKDIKNMFRHLSWMNNVFSRNDFISQSYLYYIQSFLANGEFKSQYLKQLSSYIEYCNKNPEKLVAFRFEKEHALKLLEEWNSVKEYEKVIGGEWKRFYDCLFMDDSYYLFKPLIAMYDYHSVITLVQKMENFFILDEVLSYDSIKYDMDFIKNLFLEIQKRNSDDFIIIKYLLLNKVQEYLSRLYNKEGGSVSEEVGQIVNDFLGIIKDLSDALEFIKSWYGHLINQIISNSDLDLTLIVIDILAKYFEQSQKTKIFKQELMQNQNDLPYKNLMSLIFLEEEPEYNEDYYNLLKKYLSTESQCIYLNLYEPAKAFEPRFYYLSQMFLGEHIGENEWYDLWKMLYKERKEMQYPLFYKGTKIMYRSAFLLVIGIAALQYLCDMDNKQKAVRLLNFLWSAVKEVYVFNSGFYDKLISALILRMVVAADKLGEDILVYLNFIKHNPEVLTSVLINLKCNKFTFENLKKDKSYSESVQIYLIEQKSSKRVTKEYKDRCEELYNELYFD